MGPKEGHFGVILDHFWVDPGSFRGRLGMNLASIWHRFDHIWGLFATKKKAVILGGGGWWVVGGDPTTLILKRTPKAIDWRRNQVKRTRIVRDMTVFGAKRPFYIGIESMFHSRLL